MIKLLLCVSCFLLIASGIEAQERFQKNKITVYDGKREVIFDYKPDSLKREGVKWDSEKILELKESLSDFKVTQSMPVVKPDISLYNMPNAVNTETYKAIMEERYGRVKPLSTLIIKEP